MNDLELQIHLGKRIREIRKQKNISQMDLAYSIGMSMNTVSYIELGKIAPKIDTLNKIANVLGVDISEFFNFNSQPIDENKNKVIENIILKLKRCGDDVLLQCAKIIDILVK